jgi:ribose transport system ATP-binding protein
MTDSRASTPALEATSISKTFGDTTVLDALDLTIERGSVHALLGHNGSGKSTFIKILSGYYTPDDTGGKVRVGGEPLAFDSPDSAARVGMSFVHQTLGLVPDLTVQENLRLGKEWVRGPVGNIRWRADTAAAARSLADPACASTRAPTCAISAPPNGPRSRSCGRCRTRRTCACSCSTRRPRR